MALPLPSGLTPPEIAFLCEMELVTVIPRQRLESLDLLSGPTPPLHPTSSTPLPLYLALLLHRQRRAQILPPPWLTPDSLTHILEAEKKSDTLSATTPWPLQSTTNTNPTTSPPFTPSSTRTSPSGHLPYHYLELSHILLSAVENLPEAARIRGLLRDIQEVRLSKLRVAVKALTGGGVVTSLKGIGAMEVAQQRGFVVGVLGGLRGLGASRERERREREGEAGSEGEESEMDVEL